MSINTDNPAFRVLIMGLPGAGKTTLANKLAAMLKSATHLNADEVRKASNDWDFSEEGRIRQAARMKDAADKAGGLVLADFVCPTPETRAAFDPHMVILLNTIEEGRFEDTNKVFVPPANPDFTVTGWGYTDHEVYQIAETLLRVRPQGVMIGRFQPFHDGHKALLDKVLEKHGYCCIMVRSMPASNNNPLGMTQVFEEIKLALSDEKYRGRFSITGVPNIAGVYYGRDVGYKVEQIDLGAEVHAISATSIRKERGITHSREGILQ